MASCFAGFVATLIFNPTQPITVRSKRHTNKSQPITVRCSEYIWVYLTKNRSQNVRGFFLPAGNKLHGSIAVKRFVSIINVLPSTPRIPRWKGRWKKCLVCPQNTLKQDGCWNSQHVEEICTASVQSRSAAQGFDGKIGFLSPGFLCLSIKLISVS